VKRIISISLLFIFSLTTLVPSTMWSDMGKIANLIEHFQEHKKEDSSISFWSFIELHYGSEFQKHQAAHDHSKLPLKNAHPSVSTHIIVSDINYSTLNINSQLAVPEQKQSLPSFNQSFISRNLTDIWQPPRVS
jgi:hypothetical protein